MRQRWPARSTAVREEHGPGGGAGGAQLRRRSAGGVRPRDRSAGGLKLIEGRAGTGKSYTLAAIHDAHAVAGRAGDRPGTDQHRGAGPKADGFRRGRDGACGAVQVEERARPMERADRPGGGRGGDAGQPASPASCWPRRGGPVRR